MDPAEFKLDDWGVLFPGDSCGLYSGMFAVYDERDIHMSPIGQIQDITRDRIARVDSVHVEEGDWAETTLRLLVQLTDGNWATCMAFCDTTGWDCQAGVEWKWARTREDAIRQGLDRESRRVLGLLLEGEEQS